MKTIPGADVNSDHVLVVATVRLKLKHLKKPKNKPKKSIELLGKNNEMTDRYAMEVRNRDAVLEDEVENAKAEEQWNILTEAIQKGMKEVIPDNRRRKKKLWMTEILYMMDETRILKGRDEVQYRIKNIEIKRECKRVKERWWLNEHCKEVEELCKANQYSIFDKIKELTQIKKWNKGSVVKKKDGTVVMEVAEAGQRWSGNTSFCKYF